MKGNVQEGFTLVEGLLTILVLIVTGFAGYYVWDRQNSKDVKTDTISETKSTKNTAKPKPEASPSDAWTLFETPDKSYSMRVADGLTVMKSDSGTGLIIDEILSIKGQPVRYLSMSARDSSGKGDSLSINFGLETVYGIDDASVQPSLRTKDGTEVKKYKFTQTTEQEGLGLRKGQTEYTYVVQRGGKIVRAGYVTTSGAQLETVENMVTSIQIH